MGTDHRLTGRKNQMDEIYHTISAGGFSAGVESYARDPGRESLWFLSMTGPQTSLRAIAAAMVKQPPDPAYIIEGLEGTALTGKFERCMIPPESIGTWTTKMVKLPVCGGYHAIMYTRLAEYAHPREDFLLLSREEDNPASLHYTFLDRRIPIPIHPTWKEWLWDRGLAAQEILPLECSGIRAYRCQPNAEKLQKDLSQAVASGRLKIEDEE